MLNCILFWMSVLPILSLNLIDFSLESWGLQEWWWQAPLFSLVSRDEDGKWVASNQQPCSGGRIWGWSWGLSGEVICILYEKFWKTVFQPISIEWTSKYWGGLEYNNKVSLVDGSAGHSWWFYAVGAITFWNDAIPGPAKPVQIIELYVADSSKDAYHSEVINITTIFKIVQNL